MNPKILLIDIETFPNLGYTWRKYEQTVIDFEREFCIATFAAKWLGEHKIMAKMLPDYKGYKPGSYDDRAIMRDLRDLLDEADIVVAHNGDQFDIKVINARLLAYKIPPPSPYRTIDTKKMAKGVARFNSNKLDDIARYLNEGRKLDTSFKLWLDCINGVPSAWAKMLRYNKHDVAILERVYLRLRPYAKSHPNLTAYSGRCPKCGGNHIQQRGYAMSATRRYKQYQCQSCGAWSRATIGAERMTTTV